MARSCALSESSIELSNRVPDLGLATLRHKGALSSIVGGICPLGVSSACRGHSGGSNRELTGSSLKGDGASEGLIASRGAGAAYYISWGRRGAVIRIMLVSVFT
ncbi:hypothetical protein BHE74_00027843 [Ensete ventricosum]|nr:hypothetical protein BHE74_00027843 [Ensete ventricosum]